MLSKFLRDPDVDYFAVLLCGLVLVLCPVVLLCLAAHVGGFPVVIRFFS